MSDDDEAAARTSSRPSTGLKWTQEILSSVDSEQIPADLRAAHLAAVTDATPLSERATTLQAHGPRTAAAAGGSRPVVPAAAGAFFADSTTSRVTSFRAPSAVPNVLDHIFKNMDNHDETKRYAPPRRLLPFWSPMRFMCVCMCDL